MTPNDIVTIELDLNPINPKKRKREPNAKDFANEYTISIRRSDGHGVSEQEAHDVMFAWLLNRNEARRRKLHPANKRGTS